MLCVTLPAIPLHADPRSATHRRRSVSRHPSLRDDLKAPILAAYYAQQKADNTTTAKEQTP
jgi:hypothetical protein